jgi:hypothetical protein
MMNNREKININLNTLSEKIYKAFASAQTEATAWKEGYA